MRYLLTPVLRSRDFLAMASEMRKVLLDFAGEWHTFPTATTLIAFLLRRRIFNNVEFLSILNSYSCLEYYKIL